MVCLVEAAKRLKIHASMKPALPWPIGASFGLLLTAVLLSPMALAAASKADTFEALAAKANDATKGVTPQLTFDHEDAKAFAQAVMTDVKDDQASEVVRLLRKFEYDSPAWQIMARTVSCHPYGAAEPTPEGRKTLKSIFAATIRPGEHWLYYSAPRGWTSPFSLRWHLASWMTQDAYQVSDMVDKDLLREDPAAWLAKHGVYHKDGDAPSLEKGVQPSVEAVPVVPVQGPASVTSLQIAVPPVETFLSWPRLKNHGRGFRFGSREVLCCWQSWPGLS